MRVLVLADTHVGPGSSRRLPAGVYAELERSDVILHAGDLVSGDLLDELAGYGPVHAVAGNNDRDLVGVLPETVDLVLDGVAVAMVHDSGPTKGRPRRLHLRFPSARIVVFGHSHRPVIELGVEGQILCNPGSPTWKRSAAACSVARMELVDGEIRSVDLVEV